MNGRNRGGEGEGGRRKRSGNEKGKEMGENGRKLETKEEIETERKIKKEREIRVREIVGYRMECISVKLYLDHKEN
jgi:hypothetical protein